MRIIAGRLGRRSLSSPKGPGTRPTTDLVRGALFNIVGARVLDARVLDLFAGTGAVGLEALSRGASEVTWVESDPQALAVLRRNVTDLAPEALPGVRRAKVEAFLATVTTYDLVFADPPYAQNPTQLAAAILNSGAVDPGGCLVIEHESGREPQLLPAPWEIRSTRRYGDSSLTFIASAATTDAESPG